MLTLVKLLQFTKSNVKCCVKIHNSALAVKIYDYNVEPTNEQKIIKCHILMFGDENICYCTLYYNYTKLGGLDLGATKPLHSE